MIKSIFFFLLAAVALALGFVLYRSLKPQVALPSGLTSQKAIKTAQGETQTIFMTGGVKHLVPLGEIISGGPPKDGIPSIDHPKFVAIAEADKWLAENEPGVAFSIRGSHRFYPYQILVWHEIVNDTVEGERVLITYCPLCLTGIVFDPMVKGERVEFGTSGKLWKFNLVMYDRKTESLWSQILGEAILGEMAGIKLALLPADQMRYGQWKKQFPNGQVLSRDTGAMRFYGENPYGNYFSPTDFAIALAGAKDRRLAPEAFVFGVVEQGQAKAYPTDAVKKKGEVRDLFQGTTFILSYDGELDIVRMFRELPDGRRERITPVSAFWFSWAAAHPQTEIYQ